MTVAVWDKAYEMFDSLSLGAGVLILGCNATVQDGEVKLNIWPGAHISTSGNVPIELIFNDKFNMWSVSEIKKYLGST